MPPCDAWQEGCIYSFNMSLNILQAGEGSARGSCRKHPTGRCGEVRKEAKRWGQSKTARCKVLFVAGSLQNALSTDKGIMNSHVNLSPIKLSAKGSFGWNSKAKAPWSHAKGEAICRLSWLMKGRKRGRFSPFFECIWVNIHICVFGSVSCYFAQLYLESMFPMHLKLDRALFNRCTIRCWWLFFVVAIYKDVYPMLAIFGSNIYHKLFLPLKIVYMVLLDKVLHFT